MVPKLPHPLSLTLLSASYLTGRTAVNLPEHTHKQLIIIKTMSFLQFADRQIRIQQICINMFQADPVHIFQIGDSHLLPEKPGKISGIQPDFTGYAAKRQFFPVMASDIFHNSAYPFQVLFRLHSILPGYLPGKIAYEKMHK